EMPLLPHLGFTKDPHNLLLRQHSFPPYYSLFSPRITFRLRAAMGCADQVPNGLFWIFSQKTLKSFNNLQRGEGIKEKPSPYRHRRGSGHNKFQGIAVIYYPAH